MTALSSSVLYYASRSPFARKARILVEELRLGDSVQVAEVDPWLDERLRRLNPLCKVPTLVLGDGTALYDSPVICEFLNDCAGGPIFPAAGPARWQALRRQALGDGLATAVIRRHVERLGPANDRSDAVAHRQEAAIAATLSALEAGIDACDRFDIGDVAAICALAYLDFRSPELAWRASHSALASWFDGLANRPSIAATRLHR